MMMYLMITLLCTSPLVAAVGCKSKVDTLTLFPSVGEKKQWALADLFEGSDLTVTSTDESFKIQSPIQANGPAVNYQQAAGKIVAQRAQTANAVWQNKFAFLSQDDTKYWLSFTSQAVDSVTAPKFDKQFEVSTKANNLQCYDVEFIPDSDKFLVDCTFEKTEQVQGKEVTRLYDRSIIVDQAGGTTTWEQLNLAGYKTVTARQLGSYSTKADVASAQTYLFRLTPAYGAPLPEEGQPADTLIEVFRYVNGIPVFTGHVLDGATMAFILEQPHTLEFTVVDMKVLVDGQIWLLAAQHGIYVVKYYANGTFSLVKHIPNPNSQSFSFDRNTKILTNGQTVETVAIRSWNDISIMENGVLRLIIPLPFISLEYTDARIRLSEDKLIIQNLNDLYFYTQSSNQALKHLKFTETTYLLQNPFFPDLLTFTSTAVTRHTLSQGSLTLGTIAISDTQKAVTLTATTSTQETCRITITYQGLKADDTKIYPLVKDVQIFPKYLTESTAAQTLSRLATGPSLTYVNKVTQTLRGVGSTAKVEVDAFFVLSQDGVTWPAAADVVFAQIVAIGFSENSFFLIQQKASKEVLVSLCKQQQYEKKSTCQNALIQPFTANQLYTKQKVTIYIDQVTNKLTFVVLDTDYSIQWYEEQGGKIVKLTNVIQLPQQAEYKIVSFLQAQYYTYIIANDQVHVFGSDQKAKYSSQAVDGFKPKALFGNKYLKSNIIFVVNDLDVALVNYAEEQLTVIHKIPLTAAGSEVAVALAQDTFFLVEVPKDEAQFGTIKEFSYAQLNNVEQIKTLPLYHYQIQRPLIADFAPETGTLYIKALCTRCDKSFVLTFIPNVLSHSQLYQGWNFATNLAGKNTLLSGGGQQSQFIYQNDFTKQQVTALLQDPVMHIVSTVDQTDYASNLKLNLQIGNFDQEKEETKLKFTQDVTVINTQTKVIIDDTKQKNKAYDLKFGEQKTTTLELGNDWYSGQVKQFTVKCEQCNIGDKSTVSLKNRVNKEQDKLFADYKIRDAQLYDKDTTLAQANNALLFLDSKNQLKRTVVPLDLPSATYSCEQVQSTEDYIVSLCRDGDVQSLYFTGCISVSECFPLGVKVTFDTKVAKFRLVEDHIIVLKTDVDYPQNSDGVVEVHAINFDDYTLEKVATLDATTFANFQPADIQLIQLPLAQKEGHPNLYKLIITDVNQGLYFHDFGVENFKYTPLGTEALNLRDLLSLDTNKLYILSDTLFYQVAVLGTPEYIEKKIKLDIVFTTSNVANGVLSLAFELKADFSTKLADKPVVKQIINRYGAFPALNKLTINKSWVAIPYSNNKQVVVGIYSLLGNPVKNEAAPLTMISGFDLNSKGADISVSDLTLYLPPLGDDITSIYAAEKSGTLQYYSLNSQPSLVFTKEGFKTQDITLTAANDFGEQPASQIKVTYDPGHDNPSKDDDEPSPAWWIILIVVGVLLIGGCAAFLIYKKQQTKTEDVLLA